jgi:hypothetical protein
VLFVLEEAAIGQAFSELFGSRPNYLFPDCFTLIIIIHHPGLVQYSK